MVGRRQPSGRGRKELRRRNEGIMFIKEYNDKLVCGHIYNSKTPPQHWPIWSLHRRDNRQKWKSYFANLQDASFKIRTRDDLSKT